MIKTFTAAFVATLASVSLAYGADDGASASGASAAGTPTVSTSTGTPNDATGSDATAPDTSSDSSAPSIDQSIQDAWTKDDGIGNGVTEAQFDSADTNGDGRLDQHERQAAGIQQKQ
jgi:hypothetical protein